MWLRLANAPPAIHIPTPTLPSPNGYDYFVAAANALRDPQQVRRLGTWETTSAPSDRWSRGAQERVVRVNTAALALLRRGLGHPCRSPRAPWPSRQYPRILRFANLGRLLRIEGRVKAQHGNWFGAAGCYLDAIQFGSEIARGRPVMDLIVTERMQGAARRDVYSVIYHLDAAQARAALTRLHSVVARPVPLSDAFEEQKWRDLAYLGQTLERQFFMVRSKRAIVDSYIGYMDKLVAVARQPYTAPVPPSPTADPIIAPLTWSFAAFRFRHANCRAQNALLLTQLALCAYRLERNVYPKALSDLVPSYMSAIPEDPFGAGAAIRYRTTPVGYVLYSVGPDADDDGARPIDDPTGRAHLQQDLAPPPGYAYRPAQQRHEVLQTSDGDIVAGINIR